MNDEDRAWLNQQRARPKPAPAFGEATDERFIRLIDETEMTLGARVRIREHHVVEAEEELAEALAENARLRAVAKAALPFGLYAAHQLDFSLPRMIAEDPSTPVFGRDDDSPTIYVRDLSALRDALAARDEGGTAA